MADRLISEVAPAELARAMLTALRDSNVNYVEMERDPEGVWVMVIDGYAPLEVLGSHLKRILLLDPPPPVS